jgi:class 3 adenylate cyclase
VINTAKLAEVLPNAVPGAIRMEAAPSARRLYFFRSIIFKNILLFLLILLVAVVPLALQYYQDSRAYEIQNQASKLEFFAERGASWIDVLPITALTQPEHKQTPAYRQLLQTLNRIKQEFNVDNAVIMRRQPNGRYVFVAAGHDGFDIGQPAHIHDWFPATYKATNDTWKAGEMMHSQLFGGKVINPNLSQPLASLCRLFNGFNDTRLWGWVCSPPDSSSDFDQFMQINTPLKINDQVVAILMLNKFSASVADAVRAKTLTVIGLTVIIVVVGLLLFGYVSARMLRPLKNLTSSANAVAQGNLDITIAPPRNQDEVGRLTATFGTMLEGLRQRDFIRDTFGRYLSKEVVAELLESPDGLRLGGELREVTLLVSDLRGFTTMAEHLAPQEVIDLLNRYLERMVDIITRYQGTVDEFQGDGILAFFGAPLMAADDPERAIACAIDMQTALHDINSERRQVQLPELAMGIGINTGEVIVGNIGSEKRTKYGAVGSAINVAYRIESYTVGGQILISPSTYQRVGALLHVRNTLDVQFKGIEQPMTVYDIGGLQGQYACRLPDSVAETLTPLPLPLLVTCYVVQGKTISEHAMVGAITRLGASAAEVTIEGQVAIHDNLKIVLDATDTPDLPDIYAKVLALETSAEATAVSSVRLGFTAIPETAKAFLEQQISASA